MSTAAGTVRCAAVAFPREPHVTRRLLVVALAALLPLLAACGSSDAPEKTGAPTKAELSKALQRNGGFSKAQADCVANSLIGVSPKIKRLIIDKKTDDIPKADLDKTEIALNQAFAACSIVPASTTTTP